MDAPRPAPASLRHLAVPRTWSIRAADVVALAIANGLLIGGMWVRHGGLAELHSVGAVLTALGQLTALYATYLVLVQLVLMSRSPWLDQLFGMDRLAWAHRWLGFASVWLLVGHAVFTTTGWALGDRQGVLQEAWTLVTGYPFVLWSVGALGLFVAVAVTSLRAARRRLSYETWFGIHLYAYLAVALAFAHQLVVGADFATDPVARLYWIALYVATVALILVFRFGEPVMRSLRHRLRVANVVTEAPGIVSVYLTGRRLDELPIRSGQFVIVRFLGREGWWRGHPYSISAAPNGRWLRLTVKDLGDDSRRLARVAIGTPVFIEGPYGALTAVRRTRPGVLLIAGGIGVSPLRALLEDLPAAPGMLTLIYRTSRPEDVVFRAELDAIARARGAIVHYIVGRRGSPALPADPLAPAALAALVPDIHARDVFLCGPDPMMEAARQSLRALRVPGSQIHAERFAY